MRCCRTLLSSSPKAFTHARRPKLWLELKKAKKRARKLKERKKNPKAVVIPSARVDSSHPLPGDTFRHITTKSMSSLLGVRSVDILRILLSLGERPYSADAQLESDRVELVCQELYFIPKWETIKSLSDDVQPRVSLKIGEEGYDKVPPRPLVVTVMGHVDHGKTTLLDSLRNTDVASGEAGGITQHVSAFQVAMKGGATVTFMDTPGHAAFSSIRERGTDMTDVAALVVAADRGVQEQTIEALHYIQDAQVPFFVVITKIDVAGADATECYMQLLKEEVALDKYGGDIITVELSAKTKVGMENFIDAIGMHTELIDPRAPVSGPAEAVVLETQVNRYTGSTATALIRLGTLSRGDSFVCGERSGKVKSLVESSGQKIQRAGPSKIVTVTGFHDTFPIPGDDLIVVTKGEKFARKVAADRVEHAQRLRNQLEELEEDGQTVYMVMRADVQGSLDATESSVNSILEGKVAPKWLTTGLGEITVADVEKACDAGGIVIAFNVPVPKPVQALAQDLDVPIVTSNIIYHILDEVVEILPEILPLVDAEEQIGLAEVLQVFPIRMPRGKVTVAGSKVTSGSITDRDYVRVYRNGSILFEERNAVRELRIMKKKVHNVATLKECGIMLNGFEEFVPGDVIEVFKMVEKKQNFHDKQ